MDPSMDGMCIMVNNDFLPFTDDSQLDCRSVKQELLEDKFTTNQFEYSNEPQTIERIKQEEIDIKNEPLEQNNTSSCASADTRSSNDVPDEAFYQCAHCNYKTTKKPSLKSHLKFHSSNKPHACVICGYRTVDKSNLKSHLKVHTGEKSHECSYCGYKTTSKFYLKQHVSIHTGEKLFKCDLCSYSARYRSSLTQHVRGHTGEKRIRKDQPRYCPKCGAKLSGYRALIRHMSRHTDERPFPCTQCDYKAKLNSQLTMHVKRVHVREVLGIDVDGNVHVKNGIGGVLKFHHKFLPEDFRTYTNSDGCILSQGHYCIMKEGNRCIKCFVYLDNLPKQQSLVQKCQ